MKKYYLMLLLAEIVTLPVVVYGAIAPDSILFSQNYLPAYSAQANLNSLPTGEYTVDIFAFDEWWTGDFEIEE